MQYRGAVLSDAWPKEVQADVEAVRDAVVATQTVIRDRASGVLFIGTYGVTGAAIDYVNMAAVTRALLRPNSGWPMQVVVNQSGEVRLRYVNMTPAAFRAAVEGSGVHFMDTPPPPAAVVAQLERRALGERLRRILGGHALWT